LYIKLDDLERWFFYAETLIKKSDWKEIWNMSDSGAPIKRIEEITETPIDPKTRLTWSHDWYGPHEIRERAIELLKYEDLPLEGIRTTNGTNEANFNVAMTLLKRGDEVIVEMPSWIQSYIVCKYLANAKVKVLFTKEENQWRSNIDELNNLITKKTKLIWLNNPCNPTGQYLKTKELKAIVEIAEDHDVWIVQDEIYRGTEWDDKLSPSIVNHYVKGVTTGGISKTLGMTGLRIGWIACRDLEFMKKIHTTTMYVTLCTNRLGEILATKAMEPETYRRLVKAGKKIGGTNLTILKQWMRNHKELSWIEPKATYCSFLRFDFNMSSWDFCEKALKTQKVLLGPGSGFMVEGYVRLGFGSYTVKFKESLQRLANFIESLKRKKR
jgi:aspartate/methionine/tyrosine aminotransferase